MKTAHPVDVAIDGFWKARRTFAYALTLDGTFCANDQAELGAFDAAYDELTTYRKRQYAADAYVRNGVTRHVREAFTDAGAGLVDLERERAARRPHVVVVRRDEADDEADAA